MKMIEKLIRAYDLERKNNNATQEKIDRIWESIKPALDEMEKLKADRRSRYNAWNALDAYVKKTYGNDAYIHEEKGTYSIVRHASTIKILEKIKL